jgi:ABC-2 type transport system ATP-binding protein
MTTPTATAIPLVHISGLVVRYGKTEAVHGISFDIPKGAIFGFIGPNGAGKTSTIKVLATLIRPSSGTVRVCGFDVMRDATEVRRKIGYMPDFFGVYDDLTAAEYLHFFAAAYHIPTVKRPQLIADVLALTDLTEKAGAPVDGLSRGMKQRLGIARLLLHDPEFLLLDEPANGRDPRARIEMRELLKELQRLGKTILISSHILHELAQFCTHIGILETGRVVACGPLRDIYRELALDRAIHVGLVAPAAGDSSVNYADKIRAISGVASVEELPDRLVVRLREGELAPEDLLDAIRATGARVRMFQPDAVDMEMAFMKLTEGRTA